MCLFSSKKNRTLFKEFHCPSARSNRMKSLIYIDLPYADGIYNHFD